MINKKIYFIIIILLLLTVKVFSQQDKHKGLMSLYIPQEDNLKAIKQYNEAIKQILKKDSLTNQNIYNLAGCYALLENIDSALYYLDIYVSSTDNFYQKCIFYDSDFNILKRSEKWEKIQQKIDNKFLEEYTPKNRELSLKLYYLGLLDQKERIGDIRKRERIVDYSEMSKKDTDIKKEFTKILKQYGFPTYTMVGELSCKYAQLILQHSSYKLQKKYLQQIRELANNGETSLTMWALLYDRVQLKEGKPQKFGTQSNCNFEKNQNGVFIQTDCYIEPLENKELVNEWRKEVGFTTTIEEESERLGYPICTDYKKLKKRKY